MLTHLHIVVYTWWCWHICKGEEVGVEMNQLGEETETKQVTRGDRKQASLGPTVWSYVRVSGAESDRMRRRRVRSLLTIDDMAAFWRAE